MKYRDLEEAQNQIELYAAEMSEAKAAGFYSAQELWSAYQTAQKQNAVNDAETAAKVLEHLAENLRFELASGYDVTTLIKNVAAEYRAKARGEKP